MVERRIFSWMFRRLRLKFLFLFDSLILQRDKVKFYDLRLVIDEKRETLSSWRALEIIFGGTPFRNS